MHKFSRPGIKHSPKFLIKYRLQGKIKIKEKEKSINVRIYGQQKGSRNQIFTELPMEIQCGCHIILFL